MPNIPCAQVIHGCPCDDDPIENFSSEGPDDAFHLAVVDFADDPPLNNLWSRLGCKRWCFSAISLESAEDCALQQAKLCTYDSEDCSGGMCGDWQEPETGDGYVPRSLFHSNPKGCVISCGDSVFSYTLPAGAVISPYSQADADARAASLACRRGAQRQFCSTPPKACLTDGEPYEFQLVASGTTPLVFELVGGSLPPGMDMDATGNIFGFPLLAGSYTFTVRVNEPSGAYLERVMQIVVMEITTVSPLPDATVGAAYSQTILLTGGTVPVTWAVIQGVLPPGLTLDPNTGEIAGTPTVDPDPPPDNVYDFVVEATST